ncbi:capsular biosynthesis protein [Stappia taiwanensis]|uniref:Capsular biosynthesis protein n=1 Tax=Stappia taiwanensis TaxID=992267 RepID=A0A838XF07_9HYPH|nr:capsular biosynthesis protein [Stappia taiwanensis]MBA4610049.1 capsular biosynthesis protein [Stappia taiwanensis]GGE76540.1 hypothetical protein GCM10007285_00350 [Stappia taiwanensis]
MSAPIWLADPVLRPMRKALSACLGAPVDANRHPPAFCGGILVAFASPAFERWRMMALERSLPLILADAAPMVAGHALPASAFPLKGMVRLSLAEVPRTVLTETMDADAALIGALRAAGEAQAMVSPATLSEADVWRFDALERALQRLGGEPAGEPQQAGLHGALMAASFVYPSPYDRKTCLSAVHMQHALNAALRRDRLADRRGHCFGVKSWNQAAVRAAFGAPGLEVVMERSAAEAVAGARRDGGRVLAWAGQVNADLIDRARAEEIELWRIEDGFLRSVGLGAGLARGASFAYDDTGVYFDARGASRMERLLQERSLQPHEVARARALLRCIVEAGLSKYNIAGRRSLPALPSDREVILVPGQVADDAGVHRSLSDVIDCERVANINLELLRCVRDRNPQAHILYKPHPDVDARLRAGRLSASELSGLADDVVAGCDLGELLRACSRVETFSSLTGFEALLRGKPVTVYGMPFYAGWGLTQDLSRCARRTRRLDLETLVHVAFIDYPLSVDPVSLKPCGPEFLIERLQQQRGDARYRLRQRVRQELSWLGRKLGL